MSKLESNPNTKILDEKGDVIAKLGAEQRVLVTTDQIPMTLVNAVTSIEDHRFFEHRGVDPVRIMGSFLHNLQSNTTQGGSTLTQELLKLSFFTTSEADRTLKRKAQEAWMAVELEKKISKEDILTLYINKVYMSNNVYGMQTAAESFYGKQLSQLSLPQLAMLAGMPQAPNDYDPYKNPELTKKRRDTVLQEMYRYGKITKEEETAAIATPINDGLQPLNQTSSFPLYMNSFITEALIQVKDATGKDPSTTPMTIYTTMDTDAQQHLEQVFDSGDYVNYPENQQVAATIVDPKTGAVIAQMGRRNQTTDSMLGDNPAVNTDRDWGSAMKPITDYAPGIDNGTFKSTAEMFNDSPYNYPGTNTPLMDFDQGYLGNITMRLALWQSRNIPAVKALDKIGLDTSAAFLKSLGIQYYPSEVYANGISSNTDTPSKVGAADRRYGSSSEKMAAAFASFANGGNYTSPYYVTKITYTDGESTDLTPKTTRVMKETTAYAMTDMLKGVIPNGTNGSSFPPNRLTGRIFQAGKTGTSNYTDEEFAKRKADSEFIVPDETFVGYTKEYSIAVWTGFDDREYPVQDILIPGEVYTAMMEYFYSDAASTDWTMPDGISRYGTELYLAGAKPAYSAPPSSSKSSSSSSSSSAPESSSDTQNTETPAPSSSSAADGGDATTTVPQ
ncbi:transglycosylase domain-containing protein [Lactovum odontotermitis]